MCYNIKLNAVLIAFSNCYEKYFSFFAFILFFLVYLYTLNN